MLARRGLLGARGAPAASFSPFFLPEIFGHPEGRAAMWAPVSLVILGGLATSTFLTLLVTPTIYTLLDDATRFMRRVLRLA